MDRDFVVMLNSDGNTEVLNLTQVRRATIVGAEVKLYFSESHVVTIQNVGALEICNRLFERAVTVTGEAFKSF